MHCPPKNIKFHCTILLCFMNTSFRIYIVLLLLKSSSIFNYSFMENSSEYYLDSFLWNQRLKISQHRYSPTNAKPIHSAIGGNCFTPHQPSQFWTLGELRCCCSGSASPSNPNPPNEEIQSHHHSSAKSKYSQFENPSVFTHTLHVVVRHSWVSTLSDILNMSHRIIKCSWASLRTFYIITCFYWQCTLMSLENNNNALEIAFTLLF